MSNFCGLQLTLRRIFCINSRHFREVSILSNKLHPRSFLFCAPFALSSSASEFNGNSQTRSDSPGTSEVFSDLTDVDLKNRILEASLTHVPKYGWSREAVEAGCLSEGLAPGLHTLALPHGGIDLVLHFYATRNQMLADVMRKWRMAEKSVNTNESSESLSDQKLSLVSNKVANVDEFLYQALEYRLKKIVPVLDVWPQAMGILALPTNIPSSLGMLAELVDEVWAQAGDRSTDMTWYAKRLGLAYVYNLTEIYMLQDKSPELEDSWIFLRSRIADLRSIKQMNLKAVATMLRDGAFAFGNVTCNILGWNRVR